MTGNNLAEAAENNWNEAASIGKITALGPADLADVAYLLPNKWLDYTKIDNFPSPFDGWLDGEDVIIRGCIEHEPNTHSNGTPRLTGQVIAHEGSGWLPFTAFGDVRYYRDLIRRYGDDILIIGKKNEFRDQKSINVSAIRPGSLAGRLVPRYAGKKGVIGTETVSNRMHQIIDQAIPIAVSRLVEKIPGGEEKALQFAGLDGYDRLADIIRHAHWPTRVEQGEAAQEALERVRAYDVVRQIRSQHKQSGQSERRFTIDNDQWRERADKLPFSLTDEQQVAVSEIIGDLGSPESMRRLLSGDVGSGKTAVFAVAAASLIDAGGRVAINVPGEILARQIMDNILSWWPDLEPSTRLVTGNEQERDGVPYSQAGLLIGTTALLHRKVGPIDLVIIDEQHRFARHQREGLVDESVNLLEATATCIPRSMALIQCAGMSVTRLHRAHVTKQVQTRFVSHEKRRSLFDHLVQKVEAGDQILVIYPLRTTGKGKMADMMDVNTATERWERAAPGQVVVASGAHSESNNQQAIDAMREGRARVLVATTVVEVGVDLPDLRTAVVVHPERFGLATLHQIRGRIARKGGHGEFWLYSPDALKDKTMERIRILEAEQDGFVIAKGDLRIRGFGNLDAKSNKQSGSTDAIVFGRQVSPDRIDEVLEAEQQIF